MTDYAPVPLQPEKNILDLYRSVIAEGLSESAGQPAADILPFLDFRNKSKNGEYSLAIPKLKLPGNPQETATRLAEAFKPGDVIEKAEAAGAFVNFYISQKHLRHELLKSYTGKLGVAYGTNDSGKGKRMLIDFSSPNIAKPFHAGHLRTSIIGNFITNLHKTCGWDTVAMNYLGDWGKQYGLLAAGFNRFGSEEELERSAVKHLFDVYVKINKLGEDDPTIHDEARAYFKRMEDGDEEVLSLWRRFREMSILEYKKTYKQLGIHFDVYSGESQVTDGMYRGLKLLEEKGLIIEENGAKLIDLTEFKLNKALVQKKDGTTLYLTRDIGAAMERYETYKFDEMYYVVAAQQDLHLAQLFKILEKAEFPWANRCHHINFGMVAGMSTRAGTVVFLDDILKQAGEKMHEVMRANEKKYAQIQDPDYVANILGVTAVMVQDYQARRIKNYAFEWKRILSFEGDTGPYLQYAHARLCSVERNALELKMIERVDPNTANLDLLVEPAAYELLKVIAEWPDVVKAGMKILEPCTITTYVFRLSKQVAVAWEHLWVMNQPAELAHARLCLYAAARVTLANGLRILGLTPLERM